MKSLTLTLLLALWTLATVATPHPFSIKQGINISHWLSQSNARGEARLQYFTEKDIAFLASEGFDHLRIPIDEEQMFLENGAKDKEAFELLHNALKWCKEYKLKAVVDLHILRTHHFNDSIKPLFTKREAQDKFYECWRKISKELKHYSTADVAYELMNEPVADDPESWNIIVNKCAEVVRKLEPKRMIIIGSNRWQGYETVKDLRIPANDPAIMISFHYYNPFLLTHHKASWTGIKDYTGNIHYPGTIITEDDLKQVAPEVANKYHWATNQINNIALIEEHFKLVKSIAEKWGVNIYCGEYGVINSAPESDRNRWYSDMTEMFNKIGIARACWDYKGGFGYVKKGEIDKGMRQAIFSK